MDNQKCSSCWWYADGKCYHESIPKYTDGVYGKKVSQADICNKWKDKEQ